MSIPHDIRSAKGGRDKSVREEQAFCRRALESQAYDSMSDREWVFLCEQVATEARQAVERDAAAAPLAAKT